MVVVGVVLVEEVEWVVDEVEDVGVVVWCVRASMVFVKQKSGTQPEQKSKTQ